ncbi:MAG: PilZ domain-containing protein [Nitrospirae bacterium]|nr:PilZ domain-containing protein [Nitrospirota bacterium]
MSERPHERRACERFIVPGATASYRVEGIISSGHFTGDSFPVVDISRGGLRLLTHNPLKVEARVTLKLFVSDDAVSLDLKGKVSWIAPNPERSYKYQVGIQFEPYGVQRGQNSHETLKSLKELEKTFLCVEGTCCPE